MIRNPEFRTPYDRTTHWKTKDGVLIPLSEMEESHIRNAIAYFKRRNAKPEAYESLEKELEFRSYLSGERNAV